ncbi:ACT domain-containing protein ACR10 [Sesamum angolense]|uniref:ACT domain-containing protein ACR n=1 Tax=Sesamum angolense TaxID=2727404 RepID=A0AAE1X275_9LAMI|nr:ACT domain-containing protein ACR10 [Sesamum angolense]
MGIIYEDAVLIKEAERADMFGDENSDLGAFVQDVSTDGKWCYLVFWVVGKPTTRWNLLRKRLLEVCPKCTPSASGIFYFIPEFQQPQPPQIFLLKFWCSYDRKGLLHDVTEVLYELELTIKRVKIHTAPDGRVMDLFFITDTRELLQTSKRREETIKSLKVVLGDTMMSCDIEVAAPEVTSCLQSFLPSSVSEDIFSLPLSGELSSGVLASDSVSIIVDNALSPSHTLVQIFCQDHKGLIYDIMRTLKDYNIQISYGRFSANTKGNCELDLFIMQADGKKITDTHKKNALCSRLRMELIHPLRVDVVSRGPDTELLVVNPVELSGRGRPLVFYDITLALKDLNISIFSVEIGRHRIHDREWEVYRILIDECDCLSATRNEIKECVRKKLMGWE